MVGCGGEFDPRGISSASSSSSSLPPSFLSVKSSGPLCSCAPPYYEHVSIVCPDAEVEAQRDSGDAACPLYTTQQNKRTYWYLPMASLISPEENSYSFLL